MCPACPPYGRGSIPHAAAAILRSLPLRACSSCHAMAQLPGLARMYPCDSCTRGMCDRGGGDGAVLYLGHRCVRCYGSPGLHILHRVYSARDPHHPHQFHLKNPHQFHLKNPPQAPADVLLGGIPGPLSLCCIIGNAAALSSHCISKSVIAAPCRV